MTRILQPTNVRYPLIFAKGSAREMGLRHGDLARTKIAAFIGYLCESLKLEEDELIRRARKFKPLFEQHCPQYLEEVRGVAEGADLKLELVLATQLRGELAQLPDGACTTFVVGPRGTADGSTLIGQTSDMAAEIREFSYILHLQPDDRPELLMWTFGGQLGYHGLNSHGVAHFANSLGGGPGWKFALSHYPLKRMILEQTDLAAVRRLMTDFEVCSNGNYMLCDGSDEILDVELTSDGPNFVDDKGEGFIAHSNHYVCSAHACQVNFDQSLPDSFPRLNRMRQLIAEQFGGITVESMQKILADHDGHPTSICRHPHDGPGAAILPNTGHTVAAIVAEPQRGRFHIACGNPCEMPFMSFELTSNVKPLIPA